MDFEPDYIITPTQRGREKVIFRGYAYVKDKNGPNDVSYWRCERKDELFCKGRARMCSGKIKALVGDHNHAPEVERKEVATVRDCIAVHSQETVESTSQIVTSVLAQASFAAVVQLPHTKSLKRQSQRDRIRVQNVPPNPGTLQDLQLPDNYKNTIDGDLFLLYDSGPAAAENRMILFCTEVNLNLLDDSEHWYTDGTFKTVSWSGAGRERLPVMRLRRREGSMKIETSASVQYSDLSRTGQRTNSCEELLQIWHSISWYD